MNTKNLLGILCLFLSAISFAGCSDENERTKEVYPIRFANNSYEVRVGQTESIGFVDGSGDYTIQVDNPELLTATISAEMKMLKISSAHKGETYLTITDNKANGKVRLKVKVTDSYMIFGSPNGNIPFFPEETDLILVNNEQKEFFLFKHDRVINSSIGDPILKGNYATKVEAGIPFLVLTFLNEADVVETHTYNISGSDSVTFSLMNKFLNTDWKNGTVRSVGPRVYMMKMLEEIGGEAYSITWRVYPI